MELKETIDVGNTVLCDYCNTDYSDSDAKGGCLVGSYAVCPDCQPKAKANCEKYNEMDHYTPCPAGMTFREWVLKLRGGDNTIKLYA